MNEIDRFVEELSKLSDEQLLAELQKQLSLTAECLARTAGIIKILESRGNDLSNLKLGMLALLRRIAYGMLLPDILVRWVGTPLLRIANFPIPEQRRLLDGDPVKVVVLDSSGSMTHLMKTADQLLETPAFLRQVLAKDHIRDEAAQRAYLEYERMEASRPLPEQVGKLKIDKDRGGAKIGNYFITKEDMKTAVRILEKA